MTNHAFIQSVKQTIRQLDPQAEVWLFGSRARGDARPDSDWDFLIFTTLDLQAGQRWIFSDSLTPLSVESGKVISSVVYNKHDRERVQVTDFFQHVMTEGYLL